MPTDSLSTTLAAIADPTRRAILARLSRGEASVTELAEPFAMTMPAVSKHLRVLERAGLVERRREAQWRPCRLRAEPLKAAADWIERYRAEWEGRLDRMAEYLEELQAAAPAADTAPAAPALTPAPAPPLPDVRVGVRLTTHDQPIRRQPERPRAEEHRDEQGTR